MKTFTTCTLAGAALAIVSTTANAEEDNRLAMLELTPLTIVGSPDDAGEVTGGATVVTETELERFEYTDIQRILRLVPGVSLQVEDGYGLRPNISIRGTASDRSGKITLLEDGVPIAPAPYSAPSAYYFPTAGRMQGVEVLKGPAAILQGPYTTGGALNLVSTRIPDNEAAWLQAEGGNHGTTRAHAWYGNSFDHGGFVVEGHEWRSDGYQDIDRSDRDTGLNKSDYLARFRVNTDAGADNYHALEVKLQYADETSDQTYFGLTDADFAADPFRRYGLSELDQMNTEHEQVVVSYRARFGDHFSLNVDAYNNDFQRTWFKTDGVDLDGSPDAGHFEGGNWFDLIQAINHGESFQGFAPAELQALLDGNVDSAAGAIQLRANARDYYSRGIQGQGRLELDTGNLGHDLRFGLRVHRDEEDRLQRNSTYTQINGNLVLDDLGIQGNAGNRIEEAEAWSAFVYDRITFGDWTLSPGVRYENIKRERTRYETRPDRTDDPASRAPDNLRDTRANTLDVWMPGLGVKYDISNTLAIVGGVHRGFSSPSSDPATRPERSTNYELGLRYRDGRWMAEAMGFHVDYENLVGVCTLSSGTGCEVGDVFSGDAARVRGLELLFAGDISPDPSFGLPVRIAYTWTDGEFRSDLADSAYFGDAETGDPLPYLPEHEIMGLIGFERGRFSTYLSANYIDSTCTTATCGEFERTDAATLVDLSLHYELNNRLQAYVTGRNLTGEDGIAGRQPRGARPNLDTTWLVGLRYRL